MFFFFKGGRGNPVQSRVSSPSLRPTLSFPPCQRALPFGIPDWFYGEGVLSAMFLCKFAFRKLGADSKPSYVCKTDSSCPPRTVQDSPPAPSGVVPLFRAGYVPVPCTRYIPAPRARCTTAPRARCTTAPRAGCTTAPRAGCTTAPRAGCTTAPEQDGYTVLFLLVHRPAGIVVYKFSQLF